MSMPAIDINDEERLVPMTAHVPVKTRQRVKILAAQKNTTMAKLQVEIFIAGLDLLEETQADQEVV